MTGEESSAPTTVSTPEQEAPRAFIVSEDVPDIEMLDLSTGSPVSLRSVVAGDKPLLFWFWSPL